MGELGLSDDVMSGILHANAERILGLGPATGVDDAG